MMQTTIKLSGIFAMIVTWLVIITPAILFGIDSKQQTLSAATKDNDYNRVIKIGLFTGSIFQAIFLIFLMQKYRFDFENPGTWLYLSACVAAFLIAFFTNKQFPKTHFRLALFYFLAYPLSLLIIGSSLINTYSYFFKLTLFLITIYGVGILLINRKYGISALLEQWAFMILSIWTIAVTFT